MFLVLILKENNNTMKYLLHLILVTFFTIPLLAQGPPSTEEAYDKAYKMRIEQETINGVYIPASLPEAFVELHRLIDKKSLQKFKSVDEDAAVKKITLQLRSLDDYQLGLLWWFKIIAFFESKRLAPS